MRFRAIGRLRNSHARNRWGTMARAVPVHGGPPVKVLRVAAAHSRAAYPTALVDGSHDRFIVDHNRCILCTRCVRVCEEIEGAHTWDVIGRGIEAKVITDLNQPWGSSETCTGCGKCVHVCPTGALFEKGRSVAEMLKRRQFLPYLTLMREEHE